MPCRTPGDPLPTAEPPAASMPTRTGRGVGESREDARGVGAAPDAGHDHVGRADAEFAQLRAASWPMMLWNSRTIQGKGCGPMTEPMQ